MWPILLRGLSLLCSCHIDIYVAIEQDMHSPYALSKFEFGSLASVEKIVGNINFVTNNIMNKKKYNKISRPLNFGSRLMNTPGLHGAYQCVAKLSLNQAVLFFLLFAVAFSHSAMSCVLKLAPNYPGHS